MTNRQDRKGPPNSLSPASEAPWEPATQLLSDSEKAPSKQLF